MAKDNKMMMMVVLSIISMMDEEQQGQLMQMMSSVTGLAQMAPVGDSISIEAGGKYIHGIRGLADYLGVSIPTAQKYKDSGILDSAIRKVGRQFNFDAKAVDEVFSTIK